MTGTSAVTAESVLADVTVMLRTILDEYGLDDSEITADSKFHDDLELESIDLVTLAGSLAEHYGDGVNFAEFIAGLELDAIIELTVGDLVGYLVTELAGVEGR
jgi:acyl carrier protein